MREIYLLTKGTSLNKIKIEYNINDDIIVSNDKILDSDYVEINKGNDDIILVKNYLPYFEYVVKDNESTMDIMSRGFDLLGVSDIYNNDTILINKPRSIKYSVKPLEKIEDVANKFGVSVEYLFETNKLKTNKLFVGQILWI